MPDWHPEDIKAEIRKKGCSMARLAQMSGVAPQNLSIALRANTSSRAEKIIADFIGVHPSTIWPSRYDGKGKRILLRTRKRVAA